MKINKRNKALFEKEFKILLGKFKSFDDEYEHYENHYKFNIGDETLNLPFPREEFAEHKVSDFYRLIGEFESFKIVNHGRASTKRFTQQVVHEETGIVEYWLDHSDFEVKFNDSVTLRMVNNPILIGILAMELGEYDKYNQPCSSYIAVEIEYSNEKIRFTEEQENSLLASYFFEFADKTNKVLLASEVSASGYDDVENEELTTIPKLKNVDSYNYGMLLFHKAMQAYDNEIRLLSFYKILEYFAPIVVKMRAYELLRNKLDSPSSANPNAHFLSSIFSLAKTYDENLRDQDLIKSIFNVTFDFVDLFPLLPDSIVRKVKKELKEQEITYQTKSDKITIAGNMVGGIIYSTRNKIVHAKSNYTSDSFECSEEDLEDLNVFLKAACASTIKWYNRLPSHLKIEKN